MLNKKKELGLPGGGGRSSVLKGEAILVGRSGWAEGGRIERSPGSWSHGREGKSIHYKKVPPFVYRKEVWEVSSSWYGEKGRGEFLSKGGGTFHFQKKNRGGSGGTDMSDLF